MACSVVFRPTNYLWFLFILLIFNQDNGELRRQGHEADQDAQNAFLRIDILPVDTIVNKFKTAHRTWTTIANNKSVSSCLTDAQARVYFWAAHISLLQAKNNESTLSTTSNNRDKFAYFKSMWSETAADASKALSMCPVVDSWVSGLPALDEELLYAQSRV